MLVSMNSEGSHKIMEVCPSHHCLPMHCSHRLEKYLNIQDCLVKSLKIRFALKST